MRLSKIVQTKRKTRRHVYTRLDWRELFSEPRHSLVHVIMKFSCDATALFFLSTDQATAKLTQRFFQPLSISDVDHEAPHSTMFVALSNNLNQIADPDDVLVLCQHAKFKVIMMIRLMMVPANSQDSFTVIRMNV